MTPTRFLFPRPQVRRVDSCPVTAEAELTIITGNTFESNPDLAARLKSDGIGHVYVVGIQSDYCVQKTSKGALEAGFKVTVLQGAHSTYDEGGKTALEIERAVEETLRDLGAKIVPWEKALEEWKAEGALH